MRYIAAAALHAKALKVLAVIEEAEGRIEEEEKFIVRCNIRTFSFRDDLAIWPLGRPSHAEQERIKRNLDITKAAHRRLCAYYGRILSRLIDLQ